MTKFKNILIIELEPGHFELLLSHIYLLKKRGYNLFFAANLKSQNRLEEIIPHFQETIFVEKTKNVFELLKIRSFILKHNVEQVFFNTVAGRPVLLLCLLIPHRIFISGVLHDIEKLKKSNTQKLISLRIKHFIVLSRFLRDKANTISFGGLYFDYVYPIYFGDYIKNQHKSEQINIVIPGNVQNQRRDYIGFIEALRTVSGQYLEKIKFVILGNINKDDGSEMVSLLKKYGLLRLFDLYDSYISDKDYHSVISESDYVMPLVHPPVFKYHKYNEYKISGAFNLAFGHKKPLLMHDELKETSEFDRISIFYTLEKINDLFTDLIKINRKELIAGYDDDERFDEKKQEQRFFSVLK
ncbi:hypothetical protein [Reichenbachiella sp. MALMAid0571]|uniref:hypothetical protein n=1 Tax=Reichenbachiella sp. MALMAid0571 TaxID=3143939 RepID=UPI0032DFDDED